MTDEKPTTSKAKLPDHLVDADGNPKRDFIELADAETVAKHLHGTVVPVGVAFHVATDDDNA